MKRLEKIWKRPARRLTVYCVAIVLSTLLWTSCSNEQLFPGNARLKTAFRLTSTTARDGSITIQESYLKLEGITVTGRIGDQNAPQANFPIPPSDPPYRLTEGDTARISLTLPSRVYDQMDLHLFLLQTDYKLIVHQKTTEETPPPVNNANDQPAAGGDTDTDDSNGDPAEENDQEQANDQDDEEPDQEGDKQTDDNDDRDDEGSDDRDDSDGDHEDEEGDDSQKEEKKGKDDKKKDKKKNDKDDKKKKGDGDRDDEEDDDDDDDRDDDDGDDDRRASQEVSGTVDLDHFFEHAKPALVIFATWTYNGNNIDIVLAVTDVKRITIPATQQDGAPITIDEHGRGTVNFNPERWFDSISTTDLENASLQTHQGKSVMFIHKDVNTALYETIMTNLKESATFEVAAPSPQ